MSGDITMSNGDTNPQDLLKKCVEERRIDVLRSLLSQIENDKSFAGTVDDPQTTSSGTLLHLACEQADADAARALLSSGANPCVQNDAGKTPLQLVNDENVRNVFVQELLHSVAQTKLARVCQLLSAGVPIGSVDSLITGNTALHWAATYATDDVVKMLCAGGANVNQSNANGETPLHDAVQRGDTDIVRRLLQNGADPSIKNQKNFDCFDLAGQRQPHVLQILSQSSVQRRVRRQESIESELDKSSITSFPLTGSVLESSFAEPHRKPFLPDRSLLRAGTIQIEDWTDWLWPQPKQLQISTKPDDVFVMPRDYKLKVYFDRLSECDPRDVMQVVNLCAPLVSPQHLQIEYHRWFDSDVERSPIEGVIVCSIYSSAFDRPQSYRLDIDRRRISICAGDLDGMRNAWFTFTQIIRAHENPGGNQPPPLVAAEQEKLMNGSVSPGSITSVSTSAGTPPSSPITKDHTTGRATPPPRWSLPVVHIRDRPDTPMRAVFVDFTGCRIFTVDTLCTIVSRLCLCKLSHLFVHFEVRPTDRFSLAYTGRDIFHLQRVCADLRVQLVPSLDLNSSYVDLNAASKILQQFLAAFPDSAAVHFGGNLTELALQHRSLLTLASTQRRLRLVYLSIDNLRQMTKAGATPNLLHNLPAYCVLCVPGVTYTMAGGAALSDSGIANGSLANLPVGQNVCLKFTTSDVGYLCQAPESMVKNGILAAKLADRVNVFGTMVCDVSTGCEIMPQSLAYMAEIAVLGPSWNRDTDMKRYCFLLPNITAQQIMLDKRMSAAFAQVLMLGYVEHELTRYGSTGLTPASTHRTTSTDSMDDQRKASIVAPLSVFVQMVLNPDNLTLERLTPVAFKKARNELRRSLASLSAVKKDLPYNYEMALTVAEVELVSELMVLAAKLGQSLCMHGTRPPTASEVGSQIINVGVVNLPLTIRTDLANSLLEIRSKFQHTWLSRNLPSTLPNALKIFDNLFKQLLPPNMQEYGTNLL